MKSQGNPKIRHTIMVFQHRREAEEAIRRLANDGVRAEHIGLFVPATPEQGVPEDELDHAIERGGRLGAELGAIAGLGLFAIPGLGFVLGAGPLAGALTGAILGGSLGGTVGALVGAGLLEVDAALAEHHLRQGKAVVIVTAANELTALHGPKARQESSAPELGFYSSRSRCA